MEAVAAAAVAERKPDDGETLARLRQRVCLWCDQKMVPAVAEDSVKSDRSLPALLGGLIIRPCGRLTFLFIFFDTNSFPCPRLTHFLPC